MPFYKFLLNTGHCGIGKSNELKVYIHANGYMQALKYARNFPAVKHHQGQAVINSAVIEEDEYVQGIIQNAYSKELNEGDIITRLDRIVRIFSYIKNYEFSTDEGKQLKSFCDRYSKAQDDEKQLIEEEYCDWAMQQLAKSNEEFVNLNTR
jgi:hypothetical protein